MTVAEVVTLVANERGIDEERVANRMTYRQIMHCALVIAKDRMFGIGMLLHSLGGIGKKTPVAKSTGKKLPGWFKPRTEGKINVVDLDGPLSGLAKYVGGIGKTRK